MQKILAIDDDTVTLELLEFLLKKRGYDIVTCTSGEEGIKKAQEVHPKIIILDVMMPGMDGIEVCKRLRADQQTAKIPILFLSALGQDVEVMRGLMAGSDGYMLKPFEPDELLKQAEKLIDKDS
ncbi:MAG: response regulator [Elusimicrobia bacterium]|nr:response regulator [Elusimicrobiota bacterium]